MNALEPSRSTGKSGIRPPISQSSVSRNNANTISFANIRTIDASSKRSQRIREVSTQNFTVAPVYSTIFPALPSLPFPMAYPPQNAFFPPPPPLFPPMRPMYFYGPEMMPPPHASSQYFYSDENRPPCQQKAKKILKIEPPSIKKTSGVTHRKQTLENRKHFAFGLTDAENSMAQTPEKNDSKGWIDLNAKEFIPSRSMKKEKKSSSNGLYYTADSDDFPESSMQTPPIEDSSPTQKSSEQNNLTSLEEEKPAEKNKTKEDDFDWSSRNSKFIGLRSDFIPNPKPARKLEFSKTPRNSWKSISSLQTEAEEDANIFKKLANQRILSKDFGRFLTLHTCMSDQLCLAEKMNDATSASVWKKAIADVENRAKQIFSSD